MKKICILFTIILFNISCSNEDTSTNQSLPLLKYVISNQTVNNETFEYNDRLVTNGKLTRLKENGIYLNGTHSYKNQRYSQYTLGYLKEYYHYNTKNQLDSIIIDDRYIQAKYSFDYQSDKIISIYKGKNFWSGTIDPIKTEFILDKKLIKEVRTKNDTLKLDYDEKGKIESITLINSTKTTKKINYEEIKNPYYQITSEINKNCNGFYLATFLKYSSKRIFEFENRLGLSEFLVKKESTSYVTNEFNLPTKETDIQNNVIIEYFYN